MHNLQVLVACCSYLRLSCRRSNVAEMPKVSCTEVLLDSVHLSEALLSTGPNAIPPRKGYHAGVRSGRLGPASTGESMHVSHLQLSRQLGH